ncbi:hypothetical protein ACNVED_08025 [Legionella sp. D16C41]|uniref:hypothetical protein n=1 Tax=Legionella sp. D16C41 TaxID=3402688 RepID=UPI003AF9CEE2
MKKFGLFLLCYSSSLLANSNSVVWKGAYYAPVPIKKGVSQQYCNNHNPGTFIHVVKEALTHPIYTDKKIKLSQARFIVDKVKDIYLIHGSFLASGKQNNKTWQETIYYFLFKKSEYGITQGVWYTKYCKGLYRGVQINN